MGGIGEFLLSGVPVVRLAIEFEVFGVVRASFGEGRGVLDSE